MKEDEIEKQVLELWDQYSNDIKFIAEAMNLTEEKVREVLKKNGRLDEQIMKHRRASNKRPKTRALWKLKLENYLSENFGKPFINALKDYENGSLSLEEFERIKGNILLNYRDIMEKIGMDFDKKNDYNKIVRFFVEQRKHLEEVIDYFANEGTFEKWKANGLSSEEIFVQLIIELMHRGYYPFYADPNDNEKLKPLELEDYLTLVRSRAIKISKEVNTKSSAIRKIDHYMPILDKMVKTSLEDGTIFELPIICPICKMRFTTSEEFKQHLENFHKSGLLK
ncbi:MAG: C2H2-type zinc finger protein [Nitrososphaerota archaeon]